MHQTSDEREVSHLSKERPLGSRSPSALRWLWLKLLPVSSSWLADGSCHAGMIPWNLLSLTSMSSIVPSVTAGRVPVKLHTHMQPMQQQLMLAINLQQEDVCAGHLLPHMSVNCHQTLIMWARLPVSMKVCFLRQQQTKTQHACRYVSNVWHSSMMHRQAGKACMPPRLQSYAAKAYSE